MKKSIFKSIRVLTVVPLIVIASVFFIEGSAYPLGVKFLIGNVKLVRQGSPVPINLGTSIISGDIVSTGKGGIAILAFNDGSEIKVMEKSRIRFGSIAAKDSRSVSVITGRINATFTKLAKGSQRKVYTPTTVCSIRGTDFLVGVSEGADSRIDLKQGRLNLRNPQGEVNIKSNQKAEIGLNDKPSTKRLVSSMEEWKKNRDAEMNREPEQRGKNFKQYFDTLGNRSSRAAGDLDGLNGRISSKPPKDEKGIKGIGKDLEKVEENVVDDMLLCETAVSTVDGILQKFRSDRENIYNIFLKIKEESNKVLEQQRRNYEELEKVRQRYREAYKNIMDTYKKGRESILNKARQGNIKPKIEKPSIEK